MLDFGPCSLQNVAERRLLPSANVSSSARVYGLRNHDLSNAMHVNCNEHKQLLRPTDNQ